MFTDCYSSDKYIYKIFTIFIHLSATLYIGGTGA